MAVGEHDDGAAVGGDLHGAQRDAVRDDIAAVHRFDFRAVQAESHAVAAAGGGIGLAVEGVHAVLREHVLLRAGHHAQRDLEVVEAVERIVPVDGVRAQVGDEVDVARAERQVVAGDERAAFPSADAALQVGGAAAHDLGRVDGAARNGQVAVHARLRGAERQHAAAVHGKRGVHGRGAAVERGAEVAAGDGDVGAGGEAKRRPGQAELQDGGVGVVVDQQVGRVQRAGVHDARRAEAAAQIAGAAPVLHGGQDAGLDGGDSHARPPLR